jgi:TonB-linked SusC/RagA family outer membrane protein
MNATLKYKIFIEPHFTGVNCKRALLIFLLIFSFIADGSSSPNSLPLLQQADLAIKGQVTADDGETLPGVTVLELGTSNGVITDIEGNYSIQVKEGATLVFSFVGYKKKEVLVNGSQTILNVQLEIDLQQLEEVVVIGYGSVKRRDLTGAVSSVKEEDITRIPTHNVMEAIQGRVSGVDIVRSSGAAGAGVNIRIRGNRSIAGGSDRDRLNSPLYIIDGFQGGSINDLNPNDIASIEVLKDASSTAIYGYQGANGVIIITTKKGGAGKTKVSYSGYYGVNGFTAFPETRTGDDYIAMRRQARINSGGDPSSPDTDWFTVGENQAILNDRWVDWIDLLMQNGRQQSHTVNVSGGSDKTKAFASVGYFNEESMYRNNDYSRYSVRFNVDHKISNMVKVGLLSQITYYERNGRRDPLSAAISAKPLGVPYDENGQININPIAGEPNTISPLADEITNYAVINDLNTSVNLNAYLEVTPFEGFSYRTNFGSRLYGSRSGEFYYKDSYSRRNERTTYSGIENSQSRYFHWDHIITYNKKMGDHSLTATGVSNYVYSESDNSYANGLGQPLTNQTFNRLDATTSGLMIGSGYSRSNTLSFATRVNYSFKERYLLTLSNRYDQASMLSEGHKGAFFPSGAVAWRLIDEQFMSNTTFLDDLKIRASYGLVGTSNIQPYATQSLVTPRANMGFGDVSAPYYEFSGRLFSENAGWQKTKSIDIGIDAAFIENRISLTLDLYKSETSDILLLRKLPWSTGVLDIQQNIGATETKGVELAVNSVNLDTKDFTWKSTFTFTRSKEKIVDLVDDADIIVNERDSWLMGHPAQSFYTYKKLGVWQTDEAEEAALLTFGGKPFEPGDIKLKDIDGDSAITAEDRVYIGSPVPKFIVGLQNTFSYKGVDLSIYAVGRFGQMIDADHLGRYDPSGKSGSLTLYDYWTEDNPSNDFPKPENSTLSSIPGYQTLPFVNGSYIKLKTISLGYNIPSRFLQKIFVDNFRIYATGSNLLVKSKSHLLKNYDPEGGGSSSYPLNKQLVFGVNFDF